MLPVCILRAGVVGFLSLGLICGASAADTPAPFDENRLAPVQMPASAERPARSAAVRAYARDGESFYLDGRLIRVAGIVPGALDSGSDLSRQRLQNLLNIGEIELEPVADGGKGSEGLLARVRVGGRDLALALADTLPTGLGSR